MNRQRLLQRFLRYVSLDTTADPDALVYPSSPGQLELGKLLVQELKGMGISAVEHTAEGLVLATIPATNGRDAPVVAFNSHLDTSPETTGANVSPNVIDEYTGGDITLNDATKVIRVEDNPELNDLLGKTIITTDGSTLLGGDDKAGVAIIMELAQCLIEQAEIPHGPVRILFTCDEEIGHGVDHVDLRQLGADACYTLDGPGADTIDVETFSADQAIVTIRGINIHPSIAKGRMVNAIRAATQFISQLPSDHWAPESTSDREGFLHPYHVATGKVDEVELRILLRAFDTVELSKQADFLRERATSVEEQFSGVRVEVNVQQQYRNLADGLKKAPHVVELAEQAHRRLDRVCSREIIRGGTDGSRLTELGLPTPNLSSGQHNPHSPLEWACLDEMLAALAVLIELVQLWGEFE